MRKLIGNAILAAFAGVLLGVLTTPDPARRIEVLFDALMEAHLIKMMTTHFVGQPGRFN